jgi:predicted anti-sigma-YlaC factor YlaD
MNADEITCKHLVELATSYLEQALAPPERVLFVEHLAECSDCQVYMGQLQHTLRMLETLPEQSIAPEAKQALLDAFRAWKRSQAQ